MAKILVKSLFFLLQKRFLQSSATLSSNPTLTASGTCSSSSFTVEYLVNSCGLPLESALSVSQKFQLNEKNLQRAQSVVDLLKSHNFSDTQLAKLIVKYPRILHYKVEANLQPKLDYLVENGFAGELLPHLIASHPAILRWSLDSHMKPSFEFLRSFIDSDEKIAATVQRCSWLLTSNLLKGAMKPNIDFLMKEGVPAHVLAKLITLHPRAIIQKHDRMVCAVNAVKNLGFEPTSPMFIQALRVMIQLSESTWKKKIEAMKRMGWDEEQILSAFKRTPRLLACSEEKINTAMDFYLNTMKLDRDTVISYPIFILFGIERRIRPRYNILKFLESKKLIKGLEISKIPSLLKMTEKEFWEKYVEKFKNDVPDLLEMYPGAKEAEKICS